MLDSEQQAVIDCGTMKTTHTENIKFHRDAIRKLREAAGLSQAGLAQRMGIRSRQQIHQWETGVRTPNAQTLIRIMGALGVDDPSLFYRKE